MWFVFERDVSTKTVAWRSKEHILCSLRPCSYKSSGTWPASKLVIGLSCVMVIGQWICRKLLASSACRTLAGRSVFHVCHNLCHKKVRGIQCDALYKENWSIKFHESGIRVLGWVYIYHLYVSYRFDAKCIWLLLWEMYFVWGGSYCDLWSLLTSLMSECMWFPLTVYQIVYNKLLMNTKKVVQWKQWETCDLKYNNYFTEVSNFWWIWMTVVVHIHLVIYTLYIFPFSFHVLWRFDVVAVTLQNVRFLNSLHQSSKLQVVKNSIS